MSASSTLSAPVLLVGAGARGCGGLGRVGACCGSKVGKCGENAPIARARPGSRPGSHAFPHPALCSACVWLCGNAGQRTGHPPWHLGRAVPRDGSRAVAELGAFPEGVISVSVGRGWRCVPPPFLLPF